MNKDDHRFSESRYNLSAMAISSMLFELGLIRGVRTKGGRIKRSIGTQQLPLINIPSERTAKGAEGKNSHESDEDKMEAFVLLSKVCKLFTKEEIIKYLEKHTKYNP